MPDIVEDALKQMRDGNFGAESETPEPAAAATPESQPQPEDTTAAPAPEPAPRYRLDVVLDDPDLPESLRNQPAKVLAEERRRAVTEVQRLANERNRLEAERDAAINALKFLEQVKQRPQPEKPEPAPLSTLDRIRKHGADPNLSDAERALQATVAAAVEEAGEQHRPIIERLAAELQELKEERSQEKTQSEHQSYRNAFWQAKPTTVSEEHWEGFVDYASAYALKNRLPLADPKTYRSAFEWFQKGLQNYGAATPTPTPAPSTPTPTAPAPPVGTQKPVVPVAQQKPSSRLNNHQREAAAKIRAIVGKVHGTELAASLDDILDDVHNDPKTKGAFR